MLLPLCLWDRQLFTASRQQVMQAICGLPPQRLNPPLQWQLPQTAQRWGPLHRSHPGQWMRPEQRTAPLLLQCSG